MKGIVLAAGLGTRLYPITLGTSKQLLPVYDKPMIYYPISVLLFAGIREILIITNEHDQDNYKNLLGDGSQFGVTFEYRIQKKPVGIGDAFIIGETFIGNENVCLILGDNIFYGHGLPDLLKNAVNNVESNGQSTVFGYNVNDPERYGVVEMDDKGNALSIEEKPEKPKSNYAVIGLYFYTNDVIDIAKNMKPSERGELEITDINQCYINKGKMSVELMGRGYSWLDAGTFDSHLEASNFIRTIEFRQGLKIGCLEEIAYSLDYITEEELKKSIKKHNKNSYGEYLQKILEN